MYEYFCAEVQFSMDNRESSYRRDSASRPPQATGRESRQNDLFTELPPDALRRTPSAGRPAIQYTEFETGTNRRAARNAPQSGKAAPRAVPYMPQNRPAPNYPDYNRRQQDPRVGGSAAFTEISWDAFRSGDFDPGTAQPHRAVPAQPQQGYDTYRRAETPPRQPYATGGVYRPVPQPPEQEPDAFYGSAVPRETVQRPQHAASQRPRGDYYRPGAVRRPAQRPAAGYSSGGGTPPRRPPSEKRNLSFRLPGIGKNRLHPAILLVALVIVGLVVVGVVKLARKTNEKPLYTLPSYAPVTATPRPANTPQPGESTAEATAEVSMTPKPTPAPTPTPSGAKAKRSGELIVPADWGATVPERAEAVYNSHFDRSCMIGNSLVEGFFMWSGVSNMRYIYGTGAVIDNVLGTLDLSPITLNDPDYYQDIYLMFGLNEVGTNVNSFVQNYKTLIDYIREHQTRANIYVISVTPVTQEVDADPNEVQNMERINAFNSALRQLCIDENCWYLDIYSLLVDEYGYLSSDYAFAGDGKHFEKSGYVAWANYMKTHYVDEKLLTE